MYFKYLRSLGYKGTLQDMIAKSKKGLNPSGLKNPSSSGGGVAPVITSSANQSVAENTPVSITLTADQVVTWSIVGGPDAALFDISGQAITGGSFDFEAPADAGANNVYNFTIRATNSRGQYADQAFSLTVTDVAEIGNVVNPANWSGGGYGGMSISGGFLIWSASASYDGFGNTPFTVALVPGKYYELTYTVSNYSLGSVRPDLLGGTTRTGVQRNANGAYTERLLANSGNNRLYFLSTGSIVDGSGNNTYRIATNCTLTGPYNTATVGGA